MPDSEVTPSNTCSAASAEACRASRGRTHGCSRLAPSLRPGSASSPILADLCLQRETAGLRRPLPGKGRTPRVPLLPPPQPQGRPACCRQPQGPCPSRPSASPGLSLSLPDQEASPPPPFAAPSQLHQKQSPPARHLAGRDPTGLQRRARGPPLGGGPPLLCPRRRPPLFP